MNNFKNKVFVITGASGGMGEILCDRLAKDGAKLALCSNDKDRLDVMLNNLECDVFGEVVDIRSEPEVEAFFKAAYDKFGKIDFLINLAGLSIPNVYKETDVSVYDTMMDVNVKGSFLACKHFAAFANSPAMIINIGSMAARKTNPTAPIYCMSKGAVNTLSAGLLMQLGKQNIRVTTVNPGGADTPFWGTRTVDKSKLLKAEDVVDVIYFLLSTDPSIQIHSIDFESMERFK